MTIGVQAGPDQIADGQNPTLLETVVPGVAGNAALNYNQGLDQQTGAIRPQAADPSGRTVLSDTDKLTLLLIEARIQTYFLSCIAAGIVATDDPDALRLDADQTGLLTALS